MSRKQRKVLQEALEAKMSSGCILSVAELAAWEDRLNERANRRTSFVRKAIKSNTDTTPRK